MSDYPLHPTGAFITFPVISVTQNEQTGDKIVDRFNINVIVSEIVGVNQLDSNTQQAHPDVRSIIYFKPGSGLRPILSPAPAEDVMAVVNSMRE